MTLSSFDDRAKLFVYGIDPASGSGADYTGIVIHSIEPRTEENDKSIPKLANLYQEKMTLDEQLEFLTDNLFVQYPPYYIVMDYTNEKTFTDMLVRDYGKDIVEGIVFGSGLSSTKKMLKDDGSFMLQSGYRFPDYTRMRDPHKAELVRVLIEQLKHEEMKLTPSGKESFDHPRNRHNDVAIAWELSVHGCLKFTLNASGEPVTTSTDYARPKSKEEEEAEEYLPQYESAEEPFPELRNRRFKIRGMWSSV